MPLMVKTGTGGDTQAVDVPDDLVENAKSRGYALQGDAARAAQVVEQSQADQVSGAGGTVAAGLTAGLRGATLGLSDVAGDLMGDHAALQRLQKEHDTASTVGNIVGAIAPAALGIAAPVDLAASAGESLAARAGGGLAGRALGGVAEGAVIGAGQGVSDLALSDDPLTAERIAGTLSSNMLYGGLIGGGAGLAGKALEKGLGRAKAALDEHIAATSASSAIPEDLASLDAKGLRAARETETASLEDARVPQRQALADDLAAARAEAKDQKLWLATKGSDDLEIRTIGKQTLKADKQLDNILDNPKALAENPKSALAALQKQEHAFEQLLAKSDDIRAAAQTKLAEEAEIGGAKLKAGETPAPAPVADGAEAAAPEAAPVPTSARLAALEQVPAALEQNRAFQARIRDLTAPHASPRLSSIQDAADQLASGGRKPSLAEQMLGGSIFGAATGVAAHVPVLGQLPGVAHMVGAKASKMVTDLMFGRVAAATGEVAKRTSSAIGKFLDVAAKAPPVAPVLATKVLNAVRYAPESREDRRARIIDEVAGAKPSEAKLADAFKARATELRSQVALDDMGVARMKPDARQALADRISPIRAHAPILADQIETTAARKVEFLNSKLPKRPDVGMQIGPDRYQPSDMEMRAFARYAAAAEDPGAVEERLAHGSITPEDIEAYHAIYPERAAHLQQQLISRLSDLQATLPYQRRLALSMFSGVPVDPAMHPQVLAVLQGSFSLDNAAADDGPPGMQAPKAMPQFGSMSKPQGTPAQERSAK